MSEKMQQNHGEIESLCNDVLDFGDLLLVASKSHGKTETMKTIAKELKSMPNVRIFIFEDFPKWVHEFEGIGYFVVHDSDVRETSHTIDVEDYFLRHERSYSIYRGSEIKAFLKENKHGIFCMDIKDIDRSAFFIYSIVNHFYRKQYLRAKKYGVKAIKEKIVFIIEESQNVFDSSTISKKLFNRLRKIYSTARNLGIHFIMCSQRLQDLNTKIRSRTRLLIGRVSLDDYELKFARLLRHSQYRKNVLHLPKGVWLYPSLDALISFPIFKQDSKPYEWKPKPLEGRATMPQPYKQKKEPLLTRIRKSKIVRLLRGIHDSAFTMPKRRREPIKPKYDTSYGEDTEEQEDNEFTEETDSSEDKEEFTPL